LLTLPEDTVPATAITTAPDEVIEGPGFDVAIILQRFGALQQELERAEGEVERLSGGAEAARAALIKPYAWAVLGFMSVYGVCMVALLLLQGFHPAGFHIGDTVLSILVGSSAVAAIGLVHTIVKGLFPTS
jgi:hypothetical protein